MFPNKGNIRRLFESIYDRDFYTVIADFFEMSAISIRNAVCIGKSRAAYETRYENTRKKYSDEQFHTFTRALGLLMQDINLSIENGDLSDWCGELFMESGTNNAKMGQFFTPYSVSKLTAQISVREEDITKKLNGNPDGVFTIYEPTCGAGGLIIAAIEKLMHLKINYAHNVFVDCGDIDGRCVCMTYLVLSVLGVPAVVRRGDALMLDYHEHWFTPAYVFNCAHFYKEIGDGSYPYTAVVSRPKQKSITPIAEPTKPQTDKHGQYILNLF